MTFFYVPRRRVAPPATAARPKTSYLPDILMAWDAAQAKADAEEAAAAELQREINARRRGSDRLSTIEAAYDVLSERDARKAAEPGLSVSQPELTVASLLQDADRPPAGAPAHQHAQSIAEAGDWGTDLLTHGPYSFVALAHENRRDGSTIAWPQTPPGTPVSYGPQPVPTVTPVAPPRDQSAERPSVEDQPVWAVGTRPRFRSH